MNGIFSQKSKLESVSFIQGAIGLLFFVKTLVYDVGVGCVSQCSLVYTIIVLFASIILSHCSYIRVLRIFIRRQLRLFLIIYAPQHANVLVTSIYHLLCRSP